MKAFWLSLQKSFWVRLYSGLIYAGLLPRHDTTRYDDTVVTALLLWEETERCLKKEEDWNE
jgi:hypothetical protein